MLWIPITVFAALAQTVRNAAQRHLVADLGTLGATLVRFLYGIPFAAAWLIVVAMAVGETPAPPDARFLAWCFIAGSSQILGTTLLLRTMRERNFAVGVAYSKTDTMQVAVFAFVLLGERVDATAIAAIAIGTIGVFLIAPGDGRRPVASMVEGLFSKSALLGLACGAGMAMASVGFRAATLAAGTRSWILNAALTVLVSQCLQTLLLGGWLWWSSRDVVVRTVRLWRVSLFAGCMGASASAAWFSAFSLQSVAYVRTLGLIEMLFSYIVSRRIFRERLSAREITGLVSIVTGVVIITLA